MGACSGSFYRLRMIHSPPARIDRLPWSRNR
jgi:hypothetical protein